MRSIDLTTVAVAQTPYGRWAALNAPLGLDALGVNAIDADPGEHLDIAHDETHSGQEELYVVLSGRMRITVGGESIEAGPGTAIAVPDPAAQRDYEALEPGTRMLAIGAQPSGGATTWAEWMEPGS